MGWFDDQIRQRMQLDKEAMKKSFDDLSGAVSGNKATFLGIEDHYGAARRSVEDILSYYRYEIPETPIRFEDIDAQIDYLLRPSGLMRREVRLSEGWQKDAIGPMMGFYKDNGLSVALIPDPFFGYRYRDPDTGKWKRVTKARAKRFEENAVCFYKPLPQKKLGIRDLVSYMWGCLGVGDFLLIIGATLLVTLVTMVEPYIVRFVTGPVYDSANLQALIATAVFLVSSLIATQLLGIVKSLLMKRVETKSSIYVEAAVMMRVLSLPANFFKKYSSGELSMRVMSVKQLCGLIISQILSLSLSSVLSILFIAQIASFAPSLIVPSLIIILLTVGLGFVVSIIQIKRSEVIMNLSAKESGMVYATVSGIQKIRLSGSERRAFARWAELYSRSAKMQFNPPLYLKANTVFVTAIGLIGNIVLYYIAITKNIGVSNYYAFTASYGNVMAAFAALAGIATSVASLRPMLKMAEPILKSEPENGEGKEAITEVYGDIELEHVTFRYDTESAYVLNDLSLKIKAGEYVAIVGKTGCGKSTLVRLLLGFEKPERGSIYYDSKNLSHIDPRSLRKKMGVVTQNGKLFPGDIYSNIVITAPTRTVEDAWEAAEIAGIAEDIREMPMGMNTVISEGQGGVSGGQKQRLMIARAVVNKPSILIFDEATSALDNKTQKQVSDALDKLHCTRLIIAHRLSTIKNCDRILVMEDGRFIEDGTYEELIEKGGVFAGLVERQRLDKND